jgi:hypothetical protein
MSIATPNRLSTHTNLARMATWIALISVAMTLLFTLYAPFASATGVGIQPANVELAANPGSTLRQTIRVGNLRTDKSQNFIVGIAEWSLDQNGQLKLIPPAHGSAASWTRYSPARFTLKPAEAQNILVEIKVPAKIDAKEYRVAILVTNPQPSPEEMKKLNGVWNATQVSTLMYLVPPGVTTKPVLVDAKFTPDPKLGAAFQAEIKNDGSAHARLIAVTTFTDQSGQQVHSVDTQAVLMENQTRVWRGLLKVDHLPVGNYQLNWKLYNVFDPERPNERAGQLMNEHNWMWTKSTPAATTQAASAKAATSPDKSLRDVSKGDAPKAASK